METASDAHGEHNNQYTDIAVEWDEEEDRISMEQVTSWQMGDGIYGIDAPGISHDMTDKPSQSFSFLSFFFFSLFFFSVES